jgi:FtsZ-interacting cell division protein ZipA
MKKFLESTLFITIISVMLSGVLVSCREKKPLVLSTPVAESVEEKKEESPVSESVVEQPKTENETQAVKDESAPMEEKPKEPRVSISKVD